KLRHRHREGFHHVHLAFAQYAELDALQAVVGLARSGDLELALPGGQARPVTEQEVIESHHRRRRFTGHPLLRLLLGEADAGQQPPRPTKPGPANDSVPDERDLRQFITGRVAAAGRIAVPELAAQYRDYQSAKGRPLAVAECVARIEGAARRLHEEGLLTLTPRDGGPELSPR